MSKPIRHELWAGGQKIKEDTSLKYLKELSINYEVYDIYAIYHPRNPTASGSRTVLYSDIADAIRMHMRGKSWKDIGRIFKITPPTLAKYAKEMNYDPIKRDYVRDERRYQPAGKED